jgi:hypothetical protein
MMAGGDAALAKAQRLGSVEAAWAQIFSIDGMALVSPSVCSLSRSLV